MEPLDQYALLASRVVSTLRPESDKKVNDLTEKHPDLSAEEIRLRLWIAESIVVVLAGEDSTADPSRLDRFFNAFWSDISKQLQSDLPSQDFSRFDAGLADLAAEIDSDRQQLPPDKASMALGNRINAFLQLPDEVSLEFGYKLATSTKLLNQLPE